MNVFEFASKVRNLIIDDPIIASAIVVNDAVALNRIVVHLKDGSEYQLVIVKTQEGRPADKA